MESNLGVAGKSESSADPKGCHHVQCGWDPKGLFLLRKCFKDSLMMFNEFNEGFLNVLNVKRSKHNQTVAVMIISNPVLRLLSMLVKNVHVGK